MTAITINSLFFNYPNRDLPVIDDLSLTIKQHEVLAVIGKSGCGKSTLIKLIAGLLHPVKGTISVRDNLRVGVVFQDPRLLPWKTVTENIKLAIRHQDQVKQQKVIGNVLNLVGLEHAADYYPKELSGGMAQRVALARALAQSPDILLMDEPFGAVDEITRGQLQKEIKQIHQRTGVTILFVTHDIAEALYLGTRVLVLDHGEVQQYASPEEIRQHPANEFVEKLLNNRADQYEEMAI